MIFRERRALYNPFFLYILTIVGDIVVIILLPSKQQTWVRFPANSVSQFNYVFDFSKYLWLMLQKKNNSQKFKVILLHYEFMLLVFLAITHIIPELKIIHFSNTKEFKYFD